MSLHDVIIADGVKVFCNTNDFAEGDAIYYSYLGGERRVKVVVERQQIQVLPEDGDNVTPVFMVHVANNATTGITSEELNIGGDRIAFADRIGGPVRERTIMRLLNHDEGMLELECR
jgi:hypothetical protein